METHIMLKVPPPPCQLFAAYAHGDTNKWHAAIGEILEHKRLGIGEIVGVRQSGSDIVVVSVAFEEDDKPTRELVSAVFLDTNVILDMTLTQEIEARISAEQEEVSVRLGFLLTEESKRRQIQVEKKRHKEQQQQFAAKRKERLAREVLEREARAAFDAAKRQREYADLIKRQQLFDEERKRQKAARAEEVRKEVAEQTSLAMQRRRSITHLYYIAHIDNLKSIIERGILSHNEIRHLESRPHDISDPDVQSRRGRKQFMGRNLHSYANLYFNPLNAMMSARRNIHMDLCVIGVSSAVLDLPSVVITDGNAATWRTKGTWSPEGLLNVDWRVMDAQYWNDFNTEDSPDYGRWARMAEVLVPTLVSPQYIDRIFVSCPESYRSAQTVLSRLPRDIPVELNQRLFLFP